MKKISNNYYTHIKYVTDLATILDTYQKTFMLDCMHILYNSGIDFAVVKVNLSTNTFSFIECRDFDTRHEPIVGNSHCFSLKNKGYKIIKGGTKVYHKKYLFVRSDYAGFDVALEMARACKLDSLDKVKKNKYRIGNLNYWVTLLSEYDIEL